MEAAIAGTPQKRKEISPNTRESIAKKATYINNPVGSDNDSDHSDDSEPARFFPTNINDVFESSEAVRPSTAKDSVQDWEEPVVLIVAKNTRDKLLNFLTNFSKGGSGRDERLAPPSTEELSIPQPSGVTGSNNPVPTDPQDAEVFGARSLHEVRVTTDENIEPNSGLMENFLKEYTDLKARLNDKLNSFSSRELRQNTDNKSDYESFVEFRKDLTSLYKGGQHLQRQIKDYKEKMSLKSSEQMSRLYLLRYRKRIKKVFAER